MRNKLGTAPHILRTAGWGALVGIVAAVAITYVPMIMSGEGFYEHTDVLAVFVTVLAPLGAGLGALLAAVRRPAATAAVSTTRAAAFLVAFVILVAILWQTFAVLTGAHRLF